MIILGLNVFHADTSACIVRDGKLVAAVEEERFTRIKHFTGFPKNSIDFCLNYSNLTLNEIDIICVNYNKSYNLKEKYLFSLKNFYRSNFFRKAYFSLKKKSLPNFFKKFYNIDISNKIKYVPHHIAHICSTFYYNKVENSLGFSYDGSGDFSTVEIFLLEKKIELIEKINYPHSLGILYQALTQFLGFKNYGDEYKVMGLASYGKPIYKDRINKLIKSKDKFFELDLTYFDHHEAVIDYDFESGYPFFDDLYSNKLEKLLGKSRKSNEPIEQIHKDIAASLQEVFEEIVINKLNKIYDKYKIDSLCLAGGCGYNSSLNGKIIRNSKFKKILFSPNVGDAGGSVGAALHEAKKNNEKIVYDSNPYLGPDYTDSYIEKNIIPYLKNIKYIKANFYKNFNDLTQIVCKKIINEGVVGWFQDRMEWGPRALGNRSILGDPRNPNMRDIINFKIKKREEFRPFAPSVLFEFANDYFLMNNEDSPYMCSVYDAKKENKSKIPSVVHVDGTSRVQTVKETINPKFYRLIKNFYDLTGVPILLNTSLNVNEPICENPENAFEIFSKTSMDMLVIQNWLFTKNE